MSEELRIYVADLAAYNNGYLNGVWVDATLELGEIQEQVADILRATPLDEVAEDYAVHGNGGYGSYRLSDCGGIQRAHEIACFIPEHEGLAAELLGFFVRFGRCTKSHRRKLCRLP